MTLSKVLEGVAVTKLFQTMYGKMVVTHEVEISGIQYDSRKMARDEVFVAIRGTATDGHNFINAAIGKGAKAVVVGPSRPVRSWFSATYTGQCQR